MTRVIASGNGQTTDGRKWEQYAGKEVFPWDGASDMRPFFIDDLINDDVDVMRTADKNCHMQTLADQIRLTNTQASAPDERHRLRLPSLDG